MTDKWTLSVRETRQLNDCVTRIVFENEMSVDIPLVAQVSVAVGDTLKLQLNSSKHDASQCVMQGYVYEHVDQYSFVSCGGLLAKLGAIVPIDSHITLSIDKTRRHRRSS